MYLDSSHYFVHIFTKWIKYLILQLKKLTLEPMGILQIENSLIKELFTLYCINKSLLAVLCVF